jgi:nucleotide-binding universal stress UspA family protein
VIVGYDGSEGARTALLWALERTASDRDVVAITARQQASIATAWAQDGPAVAGAAELHVRRGPPPVVLANEALVRGAGLIVVGHRHRARLGGLRGSVALHLIAHASCPVVVVPDAIGVGGPTVVGYDGSEGARRALHWALGHPRDGRELVVAVAARDRAGTSLPSPLGLSGHDREALAKAILDELVLEDEAVLEAEFSTVVVDGHPGEALRAVADRVDAQEVVIGAGAHAEEIVEHADRPVIVVPGTCSTA